MIRFVLLTILCLVSTSILGQSIPYVIHTEHIQDGGMTVYLDSLVPCPIQIEIDLEKKENAEANRELPYYTVIGPGEKNRKIFDITPIDRTKNLSFTIVQKPIAWGDPKQSSTIDLDFPYIFPFEHGKKHRISQGYNSDPTHKGDIRFSLDFPMPEGTPVTAARGGVVIAVREDSDRGGVGEEYLDDPNQIIIYHSDGTFAVYGHLQKDGSLVEVGETVKAGQLIGKSGNTGYSSGPHLHFSVLKPVRLGAESIPVRFYQKDGKLSEPSEGSYFYSYHPGGRPFHAKIGSDLSDQDFLGKQTPANHSGKFEVYHETIDRTLAFFATNGTDKTVEVLLDTSESKNLSVSRELKKAIVPPHKTVYLFLLKPIVDSKPIRPVINIQWGYKKKTEMANSG